MSCFNGGVHEAHGWTHNENIMQCPGHTRQQRIIPEAPVTRTCSDNRPHPAHGYTFTFQQGNLTWEPMHCPGVGVDVSPRSGPIPKPCPNNEPHQAHLWDYQHGLEATRVSCPGAHEVHVHWSVKEVLDAAEAWCAHTEGMAAFPYTQTIALRKAVEAYRAARP
jgi:hypothetical protein